MKALERQIIKNTVKNGYAKSVGQDYMRKTKWSQDQVVEAEGLLEAVVWVVQVVETLETYFVEIFKWLISLS